MIFAGHVFVQSRNFKPVVRTESSEELESERRWATAFANSQDTLVKLAEKARTNYLAGKTEPLDPDQL